MKFASCVVVLFGVSAIGADLHGQECRNVGGVQLQVGPDGNLFLNGGRGSLSVGRRGGVVLRIGRDGLISVDPSGAVGVDLPRPFLERRRPEQDPEARPGFFRRLFGRRPRLR